MTGVEAFEDRHAGERVFLVGNGPSLKETPLDLLEDEYTFAMNRISRVYEHTRWRPSYFLCTTTNIRRRDWRRDVVDTIDLGIPSFVWSELSSYFDERDNIHYLDCSHGRTRRDRVPLDWWSSDASERVCKFGTSMLVALQLAAYMGFERIYLIGCDLGFEDHRENIVFRLIRRVFPNLLPELGDPNHFDSNYGNPGAEAEVLNRTMRAAFDLARRASEDAEFEIYNATVGGELEMFPRVDFEELVESEAKVVEA